jgi:hypothetical protein
METDLDIRLREYATAGSPAANPDPRLYVPALASSAAAGAAASASLICTHSRILRPESIPSFVPSGKNELDFLGGKAEEHPATQADGETADEPTVKKLPLRPGSDSLALVVQGAAGIPVLKAKNG